MFSRMNSIDPCIIFKRVESHPWETEAELPRAQDQSQQHSTYQGSQDYSAGPFYKGLRVDRWRRKRLTKDLNPELLLQEDII